MIMKKIPNKRKLSITAIIATIFSFPFKVMGETFDEYMYQNLYWVPSAREVMLYWVPSPSLEPKINIVIKIAQRALVGVTFIIWIVNIIKIRKIDDKVQKRKKIKKTIIILAILAVILVMAFLIPALLLKK